MVSSSKSCENQCKSNTSCGGFALSRAKDASSKKYQCWIKGADAITKPTGQTTFAKTADWDLYVRPSTSG
jgi:hypothetical protein